MSGAGPSTEDWTPATMVCAVCGGASSGFVLGPPYSALDARDPYVALCDRHYWRIVNMIRALCGLPAIPDHARARDTPEDHPLG